MILTSGDPINAQAKRVLTAFRKLVKSRHRGGQSEGWIATQYYINGRERGYSLREYVHTNSFDNSRRVVSFAENRNSDNIVVYFGNVEDFDINTNIPIDVVYRRARYFGVGRADLAAEFIYDYIVTGVKPEAEA